MHLELGRQGESWAAAYLEEIGYTIVERNWRCRSGEIDLIAELGELIVFVEVRTRRSTGRFGLAKESVNARKQLKIRQTAQVYLHRTALHERHVRFDVVSIEMDGADNRPVIEHLPAAF
ncbi:YraN family protein [Paenibacillus athensensis]|uniref:YraN family protein n=1 Tax=Paenibacillus athensensis TaxID=1967502 RepID=UPI001E2E07A2|nr:YraN family protein [Paenibacillus athensensis]